MAENVNDTESNLAEARLERFIALEHLEPGSLSPRTKRSSLASFEFDLPPLDQQRRIAVILSMLTRWMRPQPLIKWAK